LIWSLAALAQQTVREASSETGHDVVVGYFCFGEIRSMTGGGGHPAACREGEKLSFPEGPIEKIPDRWRPVRERVHEERLRLCMLFDCNI